MKELRDKSSRGGNQGANTGFDPSGARRTLVEGFFAKYPALAKKQLVLRMVSAAMGVDAWTLGYQLDQEWKDANKGNPKATKKGTTKLFADIMDTNLTAKGLKYGPGERKKYKTTKLTAQVYRPNKSDRVVYLHGFGIGRAGGEEEIHRAVKAALEADLPASLAHNCLMFYDARGFEDGVHSKEIFHSGRTAAGRAGAARAVAEIRVLQGHTIANNNKLLAAGVVPAIQRRAQLMLHEAGRAQLRGVVLQFSLVNGSFGGVSMNKASQEDILAQKDGIRGALANLAKSRGKKSERAEIAKELLFLFERLTTIREGTLDDRYFSVDDFNTYEGWSNGSMGSEITVDKKGKQRSNHSFSGLRKSLSVDDYAKSLASSCWGQIRINVGPEKDPVKIADKAGRAIWRIRDHMRIVAKKAEQREGVGGGSPVFKWINRQRKSGTSIYNMLKKTTKLM